MATRLELIAIPGIPFVQAGDDLVGLVMVALDRAQLSLSDGDVLVFAQKIVSKSEGRHLTLADVVVSSEAARLALIVDKDARFVEAVLSESERVVRACRGVLIVQHRRGFIMANAGIDQSNVEQDVDRVLLLPADPDQSAATLRAGFSEVAGIDVGIVINDSFGRPWRNGTVGVALGAAGVEALVDQRGQTDLFGRVLRVTVIAQADEIAAAASLVMGEAAEGTPVVIVRGLPVRPSAGSMPGAQRQEGAATLVRPSSEDLFR